LERKSLAFVIVSDSLPSLSDRPINILFLAFSISFVRKITRGEGVAGFVLRYAVGQSVDGISEVYSGVIAAIDRLRAEVLDAFEIRKAQAPSP
jgi:hypothetical protein